MFLKNRNIIFKMKISKVTDYAAFNKLPFVIKIFVLSIFEWLFYTGFTMNGVVGTQSKRQMCRCEGR